MMTVFRLLMFYILLSILLSEGIANIALAGEPAADMPVYIEADRMESDQHQDVVVFTGSVQAKQGDIVINADEMTVKYLTTSPTKTGSEQQDEKITQKINTILARGNVKVVKGDWYATGNTMRYFSSERKVRLSGNAKAWQDQNQISGEYIIMYLDEGRSVVEGSGTEGERVKAYIYTDGSIGSKKPPQK
jgi:lipopolysaccharide export system protein LptA